MSQLTIYLDANVLKGVRAAARREKLSVSRWVGRRLADATQHAWPTGYFDLFGALRDSDFDRPPQGQPGSDVARRGL